MHIIVRAVVIAAIVLAFPATAFAKTHALQPFPSNLNTVPDASQVTGLRVDLPKPNCKKFPSDCADVAVLDTLDGFNIQPRIAIPFSGAIDTRTVSSSDVFLVGPGRHVVGINQAAWEPLTNTLYVESDQELAQDTTYLLVVTRDVRDTKGRPIDGKLDGGDDDEGGSDNRASKTYREALSQALRVAGIDRDDVATASLFTTQSIAAISTKIRSQLHATPVSFGDVGARTVFPMSSVDSIDWRPQFATTGPLGDPIPLPKAALFGVGTIAFGSYASPDYENADAVIPAVGTLTGTPAVQSTNQLQFTLFLPTGTAPAGGWPVAIFGHGFTDSKNGAPWAVAGILASNKIASIAINVVGHGFGAAGTYTVNRTDATSAVLPAGGRGVDQNHDGAIDSTEGVSTIGAQSLLGTRDGLRQTVVDLMQLVRELKAGIDVDGDGHADLSSSRIYYAGQSFGGIYGTQLLGLEPDIRAGVPNVAGGPIIEIARLSPNFRPLVGIALITRTPSLYNNPAPDPFLTNFNENMPLRNQPLVNDTVGGADLIANLIDNTEWSQQAANPAAYAPYLTRPVIFQFARGDQTVPNPTTSAILRACGCANRATLFRNDLATVQKHTEPNPHTFLTNIGPTDPGQPFAFAAQQQIATFFTSDGTVTIDPDGPGVFFETPASFIPEDLGFTP